MDSKRRGGTAPGEGGGQKQMNCVLVARRIETIARYAATLGLGFARAAAFHILYLSV